MVAVTYRQVACYLTERQHEGLKRLSAGTGVPIQVYFRHAVDDLLRGHEKLLEDTSDKAVAARILGRSTKGRK